MAQMPLAALSRAQAQPALRERTTLDITLAASNDVNGDDKQRAAPILVRMYELRESTSFETADYSSLQSNDRAVLGSDLLVRDEFVMRPGEIKYIRRKSHPYVGGLGLIAGYKDLARADWRAVVPVEPAPEVVWYRAPMPANKLKLVVNVQRRGLQVNDVD